MLGMRQVCIALLLVAGFGCSSEESQTIDESTAEYSIPPEFEEAKVTWTKTEPITDADTDRLHQYFSRHPSVSENPIVQGDPTIYTDPAGTRRYYWICAGTVGAEWFCLEFAKQGVEMFDGLGEPFLAENMK